MSHTLPPPPKFCFEFGGETEEGEPCMNAAGMGRGFIVNGMCKDCYFRIEKPRGFNPRGSPGRPRTWTPSGADFDYVRKLAAVLNQEQIAAIFGISYDTWRRRKKEFPELQEAYEYGKAEAVAAVGSSLLKKAHKGDTISQIFYLKAQGGWRDQHVSVSGKVEHEVDYPKLREELVQRLDAMADRRVSAKEMKPDLFEDAAEVPFKLIKGGGDDDDDA